MKEYCWTLVANIETAMWVGGFQVAVWNCRPTHEQLHGCIPKKYQMHNANHLYSEFGIAFELAEGGIATYYCVRSEMKDGPQHVLSMRAKCGDGVGMWWMV